jgi:hypothetical protein
MDAAYRLNTDISQDFDMTRARGEAMGAGPGARRELARRTRF